MAPAIDNNGRITFTPATNANGTATVTVVVRDDGSTAAPDSKVPAKGPALGLGADKSTNTFTIVVTR